jgi:arylsulfatase A-like enzyme
LRGSGTASDRRAGESGPNVELPKTYATLGPEPDARSVALLSGAIFASPLMDQFVLEAGIEALGAHELGADEVPDLLCLGLSACDVVGHAFGPFSVEVTDLVLRLDDALGSFFERLDEEVGAERWLAALTADHGVLDLPEALREQGVDAERRSMRDIGVLLHEVKSALDERYGQNFGAIWDDGVVLHWPSLEEAGEDPGAVREFVREVGVSFEWVAHGHTFEEMESGRDAEDPMLRLAARGFAPDRSPDVFFQMKPWQLMGIPTGTSHGSPYDYDRRVPVLFFGPGVGQGRDHGTISVVDIVPTLLALLGCEVTAELDGRALAVD